jgi:hypothetical protein
MTDRYQPASLDELASVLAAGLLVEDHHTDFKREVGTSASANKGIAKDLAAFAVDGGRLIIGVEEHEDGSLPTVHPVPLDGLKERVDQIARSSVDPPLAVRCFELHAEDPRAGCLIVTIPPSPEAPHKADERFWGRGDTTNHVLSAAEVTALYDRRAKALASSAEMLDIEIERDPTPPELREQGHTFVVAQPVVADPDRFLRALGELPFHQWVHDRLRSKVRVQVASPDIDGASTHSRRATGWAVHNYCIGPDRTVRPNGSSPAREEYLFDLEVREDGGVRLFSGRATDTPRDGTRVLMEAVVAVNALRTIQAAVEVADLADYLGGWHLGLAITNIRGCASWERSQNAFNDPPGYSEDSYRRNVTVTGEGLRDVGDVLGQLVSPLLRGLGSAYDLGALTT